MLDQSIVFSIDLSTLAAPGMLFHLIYVSTAVVPMTEGDLVKLLKQSRSRNEQNRITGMLLYKNGHFMQVLEGEEASVMEIFHNIEKDPRHKSVDVCYWLRTHQSPRRPC